MVPWKRSRLVAASALAAIVYLVFAVCATHGQTAAKTSIPQAADLASLAKARADVAQRICEGEMKAMREVISVGGVLRVVTRAKEPEDVYLWSVRWLSAQRDLSPAKADQVVALENHLARMKKLQQLVVGMPSELLPEIPGRLATKYYVAEAETWLAQEKAKK